MNTNEEPAEHKEHKTLKKKLNKIRETLKKNVLVLTKKSKGLPRKKTAIYKRTLSLQYGINHLRGE